MMSVIRSIRRRANDPWLEVLLPVGVGLVLGASIALVPPWLALIGIVALLGLAIGLNKPVVFLLLLVMNEATILPENYPLLSIDMGVATIYLSDGVFLLLAGILIFKLLFENDFTLVRTPLDLPLIAFLASIVTITLVRLIQDGFAFLPWAIPRVRSLLFLGVFFIVTNLIRDRKQLHILLNGLMIIGAFVGFAMLVQFVLGSSVTILPGRVEDVVTENVSFQGVTRVLPPGQSTVLVVSLLATTALIFEGIKPKTVWLLGVAGLAGVSVLLTFNRSFWSVVLMFTGALFFYLRGGRRLTLLAGIAMGALLLAGASLISSPRVEKLAAASLNRLQTLTSAESIENDSSLNWRKVENAHVYPAIKAHPMFGIGLGAEYRSLDTRLDWAHFDGRRYIHNGHFWLITKTGVFSYLIFIGLSVLFVIRGLRHWRQADIPLESAAMLSFSLLYVGLMAAAIVDPIFHQQFWTPIIGMMMGINEVIIRFNQPDASAEA
jgi:hypothetical protein